MKTYLQVPYSEKDRAKSLGARFDMSRKQWYCPDGIDLMLFEEWLVIGEDRAKNMPKIRHSAISAESREEKLALQHLREICLPEG